METTGVADLLPSEVEPSPLHLVTLTRVSWKPNCCSLIFTQNLSTCKVTDSFLSILQTYSGNTWWLKKILWEFGMYSSPKRKFPEYQRAIVPNTPENNKKLAKVGLLHIKGLW